MTDQRTGKARERLFFDEHEWATVEAAMARIIPTDHEPGAREANTVGFLDRYLSGIGYIYARPDGSGFEELSGRRADAWRQRIEALRRVYAEGIKELDRRGNESFGKDFRSLSEEQQDAVLNGMESGGDEEAAEEENATAGFEPPGSGVVEAPERGMQQMENEFDLGFFDVLVLHTRQGFYSDPIYGGNKARVGWQVIGFPGPESLAEVHSGRYTTLDYFAEDGAEQEEE